MLVHPSHAEPLRVVHLLEYHLRARGLGEEVARSLLDVLLDDVVAEDDAALVAVGELLSQLERLGDAALALLVGVFEVPDAELLAVLEQLEEVAGVLAAGDDENIADPGVEQALDRVIDHGAVVHRQQVLVRDQRERPQPSAQPTRQNHTLHNQPSCPKIRRLPPVSAG